MQSTIFAQANDSNFGTHFANVSSNQANNSAISVEAELNEWELEMVAGNMVGSDSMCGAGCCSCGFTSTR